MTDVKPMPFSLSSGSLMYFQRSLVVASVVKDSNSRAAFFATVYSMSALVTILLQMFATGVECNRYMLVWMKVYLISLPNVYPQS